MDSTSGPTQGDFICRTLTRSSLLLISILLGGYDLPHWPCGQACVCDARLLGLRVRIRAGA